MTLSNTGSANPLPESVSTQDNACRMTDQNYHIVETPIGVAQRLGSTPAHVAQAGQMAQPFVSAPIIGANNAAAWERSRTDRED